MTDSRVIIINHTKLTGCYSLHWFGRFDEIGVSIIFGIMDAGDGCVEKFGRVSVFEFNKLMVAFLSFPRVACDEQRFLEKERTSILLFGVIAARNINGVVSDVFLHHIPRTAAQSQTLSLTDGVEPVAIVHTDLSPGFNFDNRTATFT